MTTYRTLCKMRMTERATDVGKCLLTVSTRIGCDGAVPFFRKYCMSQEHLTLLVSKDTVAA
jgi:hypothetical protein